MSEDARHNDERGEGAGTRRRRRPELTPLQRALALQTRREHSGRELQRKLTARGVAVEDARAAVARLSEAGWQDDARFAEGLVRTRHAAGYGPLHVRAELAMHQLPADLISHSMDSFEGDWREAAKALVQRRYPAVEQGDIVQRRKAADFLYRRGFSGDEVRAAIHGCDDEL